MGLLNFIFGFLTGGFAIVVFQFEWLENLFLGVRQAIDPFLFFL